MQDHALCGQRYRSGSRGRGRTNLRSRRPRRWAHNLSHSHQQTETKYFKSPSVIAVGRKTRARNIPKWVQIPNMMSHSGCLTRSASVCGSRRDSILTALASSISSGVRWRMKTGLPRHLIMTWMSLRCQWKSVVEKAGKVWESYVLAFGDCREVDFNLGHGQDVGRGGHVDQEICRRGEGTYRQRSFPPSRALIPSHPICSIFSRPSAERSHQSSPWIVAFAPAADRAPMVPTMKYPNSLLLPALPPLYLLKSGIRVVSFVPADAKGDL